MAYDVLMIRSGNYLLHGVLFALSAIGISLGITGCGGPAERIRETSEIPAPPSPTPGERELSGVYSVSGAGTHGTNPYAGVLNITPSGDVYGLRWQTDRGTRIGKAVQLGEAAAATYAGTGAGKGCGVMLYRIASDGSLEGRSVMWDESKYGTEKGVRTEGRNFPGTYDMTGTSPDGKTYSGQLTITKDGEGYLFEWKLGKTRLGFGTQEGSYAAVSFGGRHCSFVLYRIMGSSGLDGTTGSQARVTFGTESVKRQ